MAKRGYKLQEFVAHSGSVNCLKIGKKNCRQFITGGDDQIVNLWSIGKPAPLTSLSGHTSPVESAAFDSAEVLVVAGASSGAIKLWDLEETKMVRTLSGHRSYCTAVEFHPFGEFFASGSMDTNLKIWDIRKKGCLHTYKGHTRGITTIRFTPDGRWVVSGGFDNVVKIWDLTAGKPLHDFKVHEGHIRSLDFHPLEFLLATGSADRTVKFWDLETFEMIGSARRETAGVRSTAFHPDGRTLFCGLDDSLKVYSWEPVICHDSVDMGWSTLGDLCVHDGKLLGGAYYQNSVGVWVADIAFIEPYGAGVLPEQNSHPEKKIELQENAPEKSESHRRSNSSLRSTSPDIDSNDIKNIYVDTAGCNPVTSMNVGSLNSPKIAVPLESKETTSLVSHKQRSAVGIHAKTNVSANAKSFNVPTVVPRDCPDAKDLASSRRESFASVRASTGMLKPSHVRRPSNTKFDIDTKSTSPEPVSFGSMTNTVDPKKDPNLNSTGMLKPSHVRRPSNTKFDIDTKSTSPEPVSFGSMTNTVDPKKDPNLNSTGMLKPSHVRRPSNTKFDIDTKSTSPEPVSFGSMTNTVDPKKDPNLNSRLVCNNVAKESSEEMDLSIKNVQETSEKASSLTKSSSQANSAKLQDTNKGVIPIGVTVFQGRTRTLVERFEKREGSNSIEPQTPDKAPHPTTEEAKTSPPTDNQPCAEREESSSDDNHAIEVVMQNHDVLLSAFHSRLTKLQVVRHFWQQNDVKGAINAVRKLPDHSVQADVISVLTEKMEIITLDLFSCLLPVLLGLLDSRIERHVSVSLELLLKLIAVFGPLVRSTVSAPRTIGVNLHAEERLASCKQCFVHLQNVQKILPSLIQRGGAIGRCALELNLVLQEP